MLQSCCFSYHAGRCCRVGASPAMLVDAAGVDTSPTMLVDAAGVVASPTMLVDAAGVGTSPAMLVDAAEWLLLLPCW